MSARVRIPATYDDLLQVPEHLIAELIDGELHTSPRPRPAHARSSFRLGGRLAGLEYGDGGGPGVWVFMNEPELHLGGDVLVPDLAGWRFERMPETPQSAFIDIAPDWIGEILSPSNERKDRAIKMPAYARHGIPHAWIIDVTERFLQVYRLERGRWSILATHGDSEPIAAEPFDALVLHPDDVYGPAPASPAAP